MIGTDPDGVLSFRDHIRSALRQPSIRRIAPASWVAIRPTGDARVAIDAGAAWSMLLSESAWFRGYLVERGATVSGLDLFATT